MTCEHARASRPSAGHLCGSPGAARVPGARAHSLMGEQTPGICSRPVPPAACAARLSKSPSKSSHRQSPEYGMSPAGGTGNWAHTPACHGHCSAIRRGVGAWAICDFGPKLLCHVASLPQMTSLWGQARSRVNWNCF